MSLNTATVIRPGMVQALGDVSVPCLMCDGAGVRNHIGISIIYCSPIGDSV